MADHWGVRDEQSPQKNQIPSRVYNPEKGLKEAEGHKRERSEGELNANFIDANRGQQRLLQNEFKPRRKSQKPNPRAEQKSDPFVIKTEAEENYPRNHIKNKSPPPLINKPQIPAPSNPFNFIIQAPSYMHQNYQFPGKLNQDKFIPEQLNGPAAINDKGNKQPKPSFLKSHQPIGLMRDKSPLIERRRSPMFGREDFNNQSRIATSLEQKIANFISIYPRLEACQVKRIVLENQGLSQGDICEKLDKLIITQRPASKNFNVNTYKTHKCQVIQECTDPYCIYYHYLGERRRMPINYSTMLCQEYPNCRSGDYCNMAHNQLEILYHPDTAGKFDCPFQDCPWGISCFFIHQMNKNSSLLEKLEMEIEKCKANQAKINDEAKGMENNLQSKVEMKSEINRKIRCGECKYYRIGVVVIPCAHAICTECLKGIFCPVCGGIINKSIVILFDSN